MKRFLSRLRAMAKISSPAKPADLKTSNSRDAAKGGRIERAHIMHYAFEFAAKSGMNGVFMEFGCYDGSSFIRAYRAYKLWSQEAGRRNWGMTRKKMYAFDSFQGLPEPHASDRLDGYNIFQEGQFACSQDSLFQNFHASGISSNDVEIVAGFYDETLTSALKQKIQEKAMIIHIDCDLYSSAMSVLDFITDLVQDGTLLLFDDFYCYRGNPRYGVRRAFHEWTKTKKIETTPYLIYGWCGQAFIVHETKSKQASLHKAEASGQTALPDTRSESRRR